MLRGGVSAVWWEVRREEENREGGRGGVTPRSRGCATGLWEGDLP